MFTESAIGVRGFGDVPGDNAATDFEPTHVADAAPIFIGLVVRDRRVDQCHFAVDFVPEPAALIPCEVPADGDVRQYHRGRVVVGTSRCASIVKSAAEVAAKGGNVVVLFGDVPAQRAVGDRHRASVVTDAAAVVLRSVAADGAVDQGEHAAPDITKPATVVNADVVADGAARQFH